MNDLLIAIVPIFLLLLLTWKAKKTFPIFYLFLFIYFVQYIFSVYLIYHRYPVLRREFPINETELFAYLVPAISCLFLGAWLFNKDFDLSKTITQIKPSDANRLGHFLLSVSLLVEFMSNFIPAFYSIHSITGPLRYAAVICYFFSLNFVNTLLIAFVYSLLAREAFQVGIFVELLTWSLIFFLFLCFRYQYSFALRVGCLLLTIPIIFLIQSVKKDYKKLVFRGRAEAGIETLAELAILKQQNEKKDFADSYAVVSTIGRLNQGWHVSKVMNHVPLKVPFARGQEMLSDVGAALLPRFLFPDKKIAGDRAKFRYYTGHKLRRASMTVGVLGDFYLNFGAFGAFVGLFAFGTLMSRSLSLFIEKFVLTNPINIVWIPVVFNFWLRANNDFYTFINSSFKGFLVFLVVNYLYYRLWPKQIEFSENVAA